MKRLISAMVVTMLLVSGAQADVIKPVDVRATSHFGLGENIQNLVNGDQGGAIGYEIDPNSTDFGLIQDPNGPLATSVFDLVHRVSVGGATSVDLYGWISGCADAGIPGGDPGLDCGANPFAVEPVDDQILEFEFDGAYDLTELHIWNYNGAGLAPDRGLDEFEIQVNTERTGGTFVAVGDPNDPPNLTADDGIFSNSAQVIPLVASGVRRVRLLLNSNHFLPEAYVGLSEVRFNGTLVTLDLAADGTGPDLDDPNDFFNQHRGKKDGEVNGLDFLLWQAWLGTGELDNFNNKCCTDPNGTPFTFNSTLTATQSTGDYDNNNVVNQLDLAVWEAEYGLSSPLSASSAASASVPEPFSLMLMATVALGGLLTRRRRIRNDCTGSQQSTHLAEAGDRSYRQKE